MSLLRLLLLSVVAVMLTILLGIAALSFFLPAHVLGGGEWATSTTSVRSALFDSPLAFWQVLSLILVVLLVAGGLWGGFAFGFIKWLKSRVLTDVSEQVRRMHAIFKRPETALLPPDTPVSIKPDVAEFDELVSTIRDTHARLLLAREEQNARIEALTTALNLDPLTRLVSRSRFMDALRAALSTHAIPASTDEPDLAAIASEDNGHVLVCRQRDLAELNRLMPRHVTDQWLRTTAFRMNAVFKNESTASAMLGRLNGSDFAVLMPGITDTRATACADHVRRVLRESRLPLGDGSLCRWAMSLVPYRRGDAMTDVLAKLDHALMRSESMGEDKLAVSPRTVPFGATGEYAWKDVIDSALEDHRFFIETRALRRLDGTLIQHDATLMLQHEAGAAPLPPDAFIPAAVRLDMSVDCDIQAIRLGLDWLVGNAGGLSVRVCTPSLARATFIPRLVDMLASRKRLATRLIIEIDAHAIVTNLAGVTALSEALRGFDARLGARRLTQQITALESIHLLHVNYVMLSGPFLSNLADSPGSRHLAKSIAHTAAERTFEVYAEDVSRNDIRDMLIALGIQPVYATALPLAPGVMTALHEARA